MEVSGSLTCSRSSSCPSSWTSWRSSCCSCSGRSVGLTWGAGLASHLRTSALRKIILTKVWTQPCCHIKVCRGHFYLFLYLQHLCTLQNCVPHLQCFSDDLCCVLHHVRGGGYPLRLHQELWFHWCWELRLAWHRPLLGVQLHLLLLLLKGGHVDVWPVVQYSDAHCQGGIVRIFNMNFIFIHLFGSSGIWFLTVLTLFKPPSFTVSLLIFIRNAWNVLDLSVLLLTNKNVHFSLNVYGEFKDWYHNSCLASERECVLY